MSLFSSFFLFFFFFLFFLSVQLLHVASRAAPGKIITERKKRMEAEYKELVGSLFRKKLGSAVSSDKGYKGVIWPDSAARTNLAF